MKHFKIVLFSVLTMLFLSTASFSFSEKIMPNPETVLRTEIVDLIGQPSERVVGRYAVEANLTLQVNADKEILLISSGTDNARLNRYLMKKLNNKKIETDRYKYEGVYFIKLVFND